MRTCSHVEASCIYSSFLFWYVEIQTPTTPSSSHEPFLMTYIETACEYTNLTADFSNYEKPQSKI